MFFREIFEIFYIFIIFFKFSSSPYEIYCILFPKYFQNHYITSSDNIASQKLFVGLQTLFVSTYSTQIDLKQ